MPREKKKCCAPEQEYFVWETCRRLHTNVSTKSLLQFIQLVNPHGVKGVEINERNGRIVKSVYCSSRLVKQLQYSPITAAKIYNASENPEWRAKRG